MSNGTECGWVRLGKDWRRLFVVIGYCMLGIVIVGCLVALICWCICRSKSQARATGQVITVLGAVEEYYDQYGVFPKDVTFFTHVSWGGEPVDVIVRDKKNDTNEDYEILFYPEKDKQGRYFVLNYSSVGIKFNKELEDRVNKYLSEKKKKKGGDAPVTDGE